MKVGLFGGDEEAARLLGGKEKTLYGSYDEDGGLGGTNIGRDLEEESPPKVSVFTLFRYATSRDRWIIGVGTLFAIIHGSGFPLLALVFGNMTDTFAQAALYGLSNDTFRGINSSTLSTFVTSTISSLLLEEGAHLEFATNYLQNRTSPVPKSYFSQLMNEFTILYLAVGVIVLISAFIQAVCWEWSCERQVFRLREEFFFNVLHQEIAWFDKRQTGDLAIKLSDDLERIREGLGHKFSMVIQYVSTFIMGLVIGLVTSWQLTLVILSLTPVLAATTAFCGKIIVTQSAREQQKYGKAGGVAEEVLSCIRTVAAFGGENREIQRYSLALSAGRETAIKKYHCFAVAIGLVFFMMYASYALAFWYGCQLLSQDLLSPGDVFTVFFSVLLGSFSLGNAIPFISTIGLARGCGAIVFRIIDTKPKIDAYSNEGVIPDKIRGHIQFRNVNFRYPSRKAVPVLKDFNIDIPPGKKIAIVGLSGAGKSTIVNLILRFYDPDSGSVLIDGIDLTTINLAWFRNGVGYVEQEPPLFSSSIYENIRLGRDDVGTEQVIQAAKMAYAHDFITSLPDGYNTIVGERGNRLSGKNGINGSFKYRYRIALARSFIRDPSILILDEATSALDGKSEAVVQAAIDYASRGRTTIVIAHRLSTVKNADIIYALKDGQIVESGTHYELMATEGLYHDLVMAQTTMEEFEDSSSQSSKEELSGGDESGKELSLLLAYNQLDAYKNYDMRRPKRKTFRKRRRVIADYDRDRLVKEADELKVQLPSIMKILRTNRPELIYLLMGGVGCVITGLSMPIFAFFYSQMFTAFTTHGQELLDASTFWSLMFLGLAVISFVGYWLRTIFIATSGEYLTSRLRLHSFANVVRQPMGWFDKECNSPSRISTRLARDAPMVKAAAGHRLAVTVSSFITVAAAMVIAFYFGWVLALVILGGFPFLMFAGYIQVQVQKTGQRKDAKLMEDAGRIANEAIANIRTVQSLGQERIFCEKYFEFLYPMYIEAHRQGLIYGIAVAFSEAVIFILYAAAFRYGAYLIEIDQMHPASVYRVFFAVAFSAVSVGQATSWIPDYRKAVLAAGLIFHLIEQKSNIDPFNEGGLRPALKGQINFKDVHFRYPSRPDVGVLRGLTFDVQPGSTLGLVSKSGGGKSTIVALLERFYDVVGGHVMVDGYDVRSLNVKHLRAHIGVVSQEPVLFDCSIRENIAYGYGDGTDVPFELILEAAKCANIHEFIISLPNGYDTKCGEKGVLLSGGEKQRIAISRALVRDPKILLLDEATSALDSESEKVVQEALERARAGRTCIIIAHRLSTIQNANQIAVLSKGKIVEMGSHDQLKNARGMYWRLTKNQHITY